MAINPETQYPGKIAPSSADYPFGEARNITLPGDGTGTPWEAALVNDIFGFQQELLSRANKTPSGNPERVGASQYMESLEQLVGVTLGSITENAAGVSLVNSQLYRFFGFSAGSIEGGGPFVGRTSAPKSGHDGVNIVSPTVPAASDQPGATLAEREANFRAGLGETDPSGNGVFVRLQETVREPLSNYAFTQMGKAFDSQDPAAPVNDNFAAWVHATIDYDADDDEFIIFYNINPGHDISRNRVLLTKKAPDGVFSTPTVVADNGGVESLKTQAAGIAPNGDYLALVGVFNWGNSTPIRTDIYRSTNKGSTWSVTTMRDSSTNDPIIAYNGDVSGFLKLASGRIITLAVEPSPSFLTRIYYSDDNGTSWTKASIAGAPTDVTEPGWVELPDGTIVCMARAAVRSGSTTSVIPAKFMLSYDSGVTWTEPVDSTSITDFTLSNGQMLLDEESETVEFIHHSRYAQPDGFTSFYIATASYNDAKADRFSKQVRVGKLAAYVPIQDSSGDSGYVGAAKAANGVINAFYYNGLRNAAQINYAVGRRVAAQEREYFIDLITGEKAGTAGTAGGYQTVIYSGKLESYQPVAPVAEGLIVDTGTFRKNEGSLQFNLVAAGRAGAAMLGGIDLTNVNSLNVAYHNFTLDTGADFGIALYSIPNPATATDNRVALAANGDLGPGVVSLDVSALTGVYYPQMMLSNNTDDGGGGSEARAYEFWLEGPIKLGPLPSEPGINHSLYFRGNENQYLSVNWETGFTQNAPAANFTEDRIILTADGSSSVAIQSVRTGLVDLTNRTMVEAIVDVDITNPTEADFGIAIYNTASPSNSGDGRVLFNYTKIEGRYKATLDVSSLTGDYYVYITANANTQNGAPGVTTGQIFDVRFY